MFSKMKDHMNNDQKMFKQATLHTCISVSLEARRILAPWPSSLEDLGAHTRDARTLVPNRS